MEEIDYSKYIYRSGNDKYSRNHEKNTIRPPKKPENQKVKIFTTIMVIVMCFAIVLLCIDFFSKGKIIDSIYALIKKTEYKYYCVAKSYPTREMAHAGALQTESGGGAAYLFSENEMYYVVIGIYSENSDAQRVASKISGSFVYDLVYATSSTSLANLIDDFFSDMSSCLDKIDLGTYTESTLNSVRDNYLVLFSAIEPTNEKETMLISFISSCLNDLSPGTTERANLLFQTRHSLCSIIFSARDAF